MAPLLWATTLTMALVAHALVVATIFAFVTWHYSRLPGTHEPLITALTFSGIVALLNLAVVALWEPGLAPFHSVFGFWSPVVLVFGVTGLVAEFVSNPLCARSE
jgi:O-antigen/teichoic acid export membrane protein